MGARAQQSRQRAGIRARNPSPGMRLGPAATIPLGGSGAAAPRRVQSGGNHCQRCIGDRVNVCTAMRLGSATAVSPRRFPRCCPAVGAAAATITSGASGTGSRCAPRCDSGPLQPFPLGGSRAAVRRSVRRRQPSPAVHRGPGQHVQRGATGVRCRGFPSEVPALPSGGRCGGGNHHQRCIGGRVNMCSGVRLGSGTAIPLGGFPRCCPADGAAAATITSGASGARCGDSLSEVPAPLSGGWVPRSSPGVHDRPARNRSAGCARGPCGAVP